MPGSFSVIIESVVSAKNAKDSPEVDKSEPKGSWTVTVRVESIGEYKGSVGLTHTHSGSPSPAPDYTPPSNNVYVPKNGYVTYFYTATTTVDVMLLVIGNDSTLSDSDTHFIDAP